MYTHTHTHTHTQCLCQRPPSPRPLMPRSNDVSMVLRRSAFASARPPAPSQGITEKFERLDQSRGVRRSVSASVRPPSSARPL
jgi:hypothetical protein